MEGIRSLPDFNQMEARARLKQSFLHPKCLLKNELRPHSDLSIAPSVALLGVRQHD